VPTHSQKTDQQTQLCVGYCKKEKEQDEDHKRPSTWQSQIYKAWV